MNLYVPYRVIQALSSNAICCDISPEKHSGQDSPSTPSISNISTSSSTSGVFSVGNFEIPTHWRPDVLRLKG